MLENSLPTDKIYPNPTPVVINISAPIIACQANDQVCLRPIINEGAEAGIMTFLNSKKPLAPIFRAACRYMGGIFLIAPYVEFITENTEFMTMTKSIPRSLNPIRRIAKGTHAILGKDWNPKANEFMVFPNCLNLTITSPTHPPITTEITNPTNNCHSETMILSIKIFSCTKSTKDWATIAGEGRETTGQICSQNTICQINRKTIKNVITLKTSFALNLMCFFEFMGEFMSEILSIDYSLLGNSILL